MDPHATKEIGNILVRDVMTSNVIKVKPDDSVVAVGNLLASRRISGAVVMENNSIVGVISKESFVMGVKYMGVNPIDSFKVRDFMARKYEVARADEPLNDVVDRIVISPQRIDRLLVLENDKLVGILTKSDIAKVFAENAKDRFKVRDLMQFNPVVVNDYTSVSKILNEITVSKEKRVIVMSGQKVLGVITVLDLSIALFEKLKEYKGKDVIELIKLEDIITLDPITIRETDDAAEAARIMVEKRVGGLPVFDNQLRGVITKTDFLKGYKALKDAKKLK